MNLKLNHLVKTLRDELNQYGEMLVLLDLYHKTAAELTETDFYVFSKEIQEQGLAIQRTRYERELARQELAAQMQLNSVVPVEKMIPQLPEEYQQLVNELTRENRQLMEQVVESLHRKNYAPRIAKSDPVAA